MTSKISFSKLVKRTIKEQVSLTFLSCVYAVFGIISTIFQLQSAMDPTYMDQASKISVYALVARVFSPEKGAVILSFSVILACVFAFATLRHLHSRAQSDFYGSLPVTRRTQLTVLFVSSFLIYLIPTLVQYGVDLLAVAFTGHLSGQLLLNILTTLSIAILSFVLTWFTAALAMILTGHLFIGALGLFVFLGYGPLVLEYLIPFYAEHFFTTYGAGQIPDGIFYNILNHLSPVTICIRLASENENNLWVLSEHAKILLITVLLILILGALAYFLYDKRPAEAAGNAMAFPKGNTFWGILFIVPAALYTGFFLSQIATGTFGRIWLLPGILLGLVIFSVVIEFLFEFDIKAVFHHKKLVSACFVICMLFFAVFQFDLIGYDHWTPDKDQIESIRFRYLNNVLNSNYRIYGMLDGSAVDDIISLSEGMRGEDLDAAYNLAIAYAGNHEAVKSGDIYENSEDTDRFYEDTVIVEYVMKNGQKKIRHYSIILSDKDANLQAAFEREGFKDDYFLQYVLEPEMISKAEWFDGSEYQSLNLKDEELKEFLDAYKKDLSEFTLTECLTQNPVSDVQLTLSNSRTISSLIYPSFRNTAAFLKKYNIEALIPRYEKEGVTKIQVTEYNYDDGREKAYTISSQDDIEKLLPYLASSDIFFNYMAIHDENIQIYTKTGSSYFVTITEEGLEILRSMHH